jgi:hypothetical protein
MNRKIERDQLIADIGSVEALLRRIPANDHVGRLGFESRLQELQLQLAKLGEREENRASVALYFGGDPVFGSRGVQAEFGSAVIATYQDLIAKVWSTLGGGSLPLKGQIRDREATHLHITGLLHGSVGFLLEELDQQGEPLFATPLKEAASKVTDYLEKFVAEDDPSFDALVEEINPRIFISLREFFGRMHKRRAVFRLVEGERDKAFDRTAIERAYDRAEAMEIDDEEIPIEGELIGVVPYGRKFEFRRYPTNELISGKVDEVFSESYLQRMHEEQLVGRRWQAVLRRRETRKPGRVFESFTLLELKEVHPSDGNAPPEARPQH